VVLTHGSRTSRSHGRVEKSLMRIEGRVLPLSGLAATFPMFLFGRGIHSSTDWYYRYKVALWLAANSCSTLHDLGAAEAAALSRRQGQTNPVNLGRQLPNQK
jgi:hypothetical protein